MNSYLVQSLQNGAFDFSEFLWIHVFFSSKSTVDKACWGHVQEFSVL